MALTIYVCDACVCERAPLSLPRVRARSRLSMPRSLDPRILLGFMPLPGAVHVKKGGRCYWRSTRVTPKTEESEDSRGCGEECDCLGMQGVDLSDIEDPPPVKRESEAEERERKRKRKPLPEGWSSWVFDKERWEWVCEECDGRWSKDMKQASFPDENGWIKLTWARELSGSCTCPMAPDHVLESLGLDTLQPPDRSASQSL